MQFARKAFEVEKNKISYNEKSSENYYGSLYSRQMTDLRNAFRIVSL